MNLRRFLGTAVIFATAGLALQITLLLLPTALADTPQLVPMPTAGSVLGWELNMNRTYSQKLDQQLDKLPSKSNGSPVIILDDTVRSKQHNQSNDQDFLLNIPNSAKPPSIQPEN